MQNGTPPVSRPRPRAICVLGPGRSGTSLTVRLLGLGGAYLGPEAELSTATGIPANPRGFWEHRRIAQVNQRVLEALGGHWSRPPPMPPGWERSEQLAEERERAADLLARTFAGQALWAWKDARGSLTLPFWQRLLPTDRFDVRYVICLRNPLDVASSLSPPDPLDRRESIDLWLTYVASALVNTAGRPRLLLPYEGYFENWRATVERLLAFAGCELPAAGGAVESRMREFTDPGLWRHRSSPEQAMADPAMSDRARSLYLVVGLLAISDPDPGLAEAADRFARRLLEERGAV